MLGGLSVVRGMLLVVLGYLVGIGVNWAADRLAPAGRRCPFCRSQQRGGWALVAYVRQQGRCLSCAAPLTLRPVAVELLTAVGLPWLWLRWLARAGAQDVVAGAFLTVNLLILLLISITDVEQRRIPNAVAYPALGVALLAAWARPPGNWRNSLAGGAVALAIFLLLYALGLGIARLHDSSAPALGAGDVKLAALVGLLTGLPGAVVALGLGILAAAIVATLLIVVSALRGDYRADQTMPYAPFLAAGAAVVLLFGY